ncbi:MAG: hypothetical protein ACPG5W_13240, partial [Flavobacteriales bacterium]
MKKLFALITFAAVLNFSYAPAVFALEGDGDTTEVVDGTEATGEEMTTKAEEVADAAPAAPEAEES